jgi:uncharacterized membrane protein
MTKADFFTRLDRSLKGLPKEERQSIIRDFEEHFHDSIREGKSEEETAEMLGNPAAIGRLAKTELLVQEAETKKTAKSIVRAVFAAAGLGLFNIIVVIGPYMGIVGVLIGLWSTAVSLAVSGIGAIAATAFVPVVQNFIGITPSAVAFVIFFGIGMSALGGLFGIGIVYVSKWFGQLTLAYARLTVRIVKGDKGGTA